jgi:hypothetical protein
MFEQRLIGDTDSCRKCWRDMMNNDVRELVYLEKLLAA